MTRHPPGEYRQFLLGRHRQHRCARRLARSARHILVNNAGATSHPEDFGEAVDETSRASTASPPPVAPLLEASSQVPAACASRLDHFDAWKCSWQFRSSPATAPPKAGLVLMTKSLAQGWGQRGIRTQRRRPGPSPHADDDPLTPTTQLTAPATAGPAPWRSTAGASPEDTRLAGVARIASSRSAPPRPSSPASADRERRLYIAEERSSHPLRFLTALAGPAAGVADPDGRSLRRCRRWQASACRRP